ncbi:hypothetical protein ZIOFF_040489 [Zingiber officinale]|uniref:RING-type E3 ubiquitin transferase n=1 Tax=Zingiber officinale TaxID=94328 RepID=A0A8J5G6C8_ZINOF|nr:hypothetical protein ZIOFF_040489 [Zingiber officinale]
MANASDDVPLDSLTVACSPLPMPCDSSVASSFPLNSNFSEFSLSEASTEEIASRHFPSRLDLEFEREEDGEFLDRDYDWAADEFFVGRSMNSPSASIDFFRAHPIDSRILRMAGFESDSDSDDQHIITIGASFDEGEGREDLDAVSADLDLGIPLPWDCFPSEGGRRDPNDEFEWEEVDARVEERDSIGVMVIGEEERSEVNRQLDHDEDQARDVGWEVLMSVNSLGRNTVDPEDVEPYIVDEQESLEDASDSEAYEVLIGQFADDSTIKVSPPASKSVVESLPSVLLTEEEVANADAVCAVCKDGILVEERVKRLPCSHLYHKECILPWLEIRNSCPLCRFELPTDDPEYENWKGRTAAAVAAAAGIGVTSDEESQLRYDFEVLSVAFAELIDAKELFFIDVGAVVSDTFMEAMFHILKDAKSEIA